MSEPANFIFTICQTAATAALRTEIAANVPELTLAFSQPGFVTFKLTGEGSLPEKFSLPSTLARTYGWVLGKTKADEAGKMVDEILSHPRVATANRIHVYERESFVPGEKGFEPGVSLLAAEISEIFKQRLAASELPNRSEIRVNEIAGADDEVFDVIIVKPDEWWFGYHFASNKALRWVGGVPFIDTEQDVISRAYFKLEEALLWSGIQLDANEICAEIGSAPGGACQLLLERGHSVIAIDPADLDVEVASHPNLLHLKKRGRDVRKKELKDARWLLADVNISPSDILDTVEDIVTNQHTNVRGLILTMKVSDWSSISQVPELMQRVRKMGFGVVRARQLAFNRQEFCLFAARDKFDLRLRTKKKGKADKTGSKRESSKSAASSVATEKPANPAEDAGAPTSE